MSFVEEIQWDEDLLAAIGRHADALGEVCRRAASTGETGVPVLIAYLDGVDWCPTVLADSTGWRFALTSFGEMVRVGAVSERAAEVMEGIFAKDPRHHFHVFNAEITRVNLRSFPISKESEG